MKSPMHRFVKRVTRNAVRGRTPMGHRLPDPMAATRRIQKRLAAAGLGMPAANTSATGTVGGPASSNVPGGRVLVGRSPAQRGSIGWRLFVPDTPGAVGTAMPLVVMLHGCTQDAQDFARGTRMDVVAAERGCCVLYPEQTGQANAQRCWNWFKHTHQSAERGEPATLLALIEEITVAHGIDRDRVYVAGLSAGGAMAAILGEVAPRLLAGVGVHSGLGAGAATDLPSAFGAMQGQGVAPSAASGVPVIVFHGSADSTVHPDNGAALVQACAHATPSLLQRTRQVQENGRRVDVTCWEDIDSGAARVEHWAIDGAGHAWSGGDAAGSYTDATGPDASRVMLGFFLERSRARRRAA